ncbi:hypothetical protein K466DRAFT_662269 [Polyporus arcularius HHB13444]|uniref:F-box domain-containing protein n=1 Tax=Polyporus arcularius HHB13444 TaxID=1314778 RepID=A0A5C3PHU8_9APHY|nr:hypothetical protein K466DRAFT_662269 [Polyporus arcularius HHB13444]
MSPTLTDLPAELLHMIFSELQYLIRDFRCACYSIRPSTLTCIKLRKVAVDYLQFPHVECDLAHFLRFIRDHPRPAQTVRNLDLYVEHPSGSTIPNAMADGSILNADFVEAIQEFCPNVVSLALKDITYTPPVTQENHAGPRTESLRLQRLALTCARGALGWSLSSLMHVVSLTAPKKLVVQIEGDGYSEEVFDPRVVVGLSAVANLAVRISDSNKKPVASLLHALSQTLAPDSLKTIEVQYDSKESLRALGELLQHIGANVTKLTVIASLPSDLEQRQDWIDPFDDWTLLDIRPCKKLEYLACPIHVRRRNTVDRPLSHVGVGLLANYAPQETLRRVVVNLHGVSRAGTLRKSSRSVLQLQQFDKVLTHARFPHLLEFALHVRFTPYLRAEELNAFTRECKDSARWTLHGLSLRGVLKTQFHSELE